MEMSSICGINHLDLDLELDFLSYPDNLTDAIQGRFFHRAIELVESGHCDVNSVDDDDEPFLHSALFYGRHDRSQRLTLIQTLLEHGADINSTEPSLGRTILMKSFENHDSDVLDMLLADPWISEHDFEATDKDGNSALGVALRFRLQPEALPVSYIIKLLVHDANVKHCNIDNYQPLDIVVLCGDIEAAGILLERSAPIRTAPRPAILMPPLVVCALANDVEMARVLIRSGGQLNANHYVAETPLYVALQTRNMAVTNLFIESGCWLNWEPYLVDTFHKQSLIKFTIPGILSDEPGLADRLRGLAETPVSLKKQCRSFLWQYLKDNKLSPTTVSKLHVPRTLTEYMFLL